MIVSNQVLVDGIPDCVRFCSDFGAGVGQTLSALDGRNAPHMVSPRPGEPHLDDIESGVVRLVEQSTSNSNTAKTSWGDQFRPSARSEGGAAKLMEVLRGNDAG